MSEPICPTCASKNSRTFHVEAGVKSQRGFCRFCMSEYFAEFDEAGRITNLVYGTGAISARTVIRNLQAQIDNLKAEVEALRLNAGVSRV